MSLAVRIQISGALDGATVPTIPAGVKQSDGSYLITITGNAGILPLAALLAALPVENGDVFLPRLGWAGGTVNSMNVLGPGLAAFGPDRVLEQGAVNAVFIPELGGMRLLSDGAGPFEVTFNVIRPTQQADQVRAACCQAELEALAALDGAWNPGFTYWVDKSYTGGDSDGSPSRPFTTIQEAIDLAWTEVAAVSFDNQATVMVAGGGTAAQAYAETALVFYPFVNVIGYGGSEDGVRITSAAPIRLYSFGYYNLVNLRFESDWDCPMTSGPYFGWYVWARLWRCRFDAEFKTNGLGGLWHWWELHDCYFSGGGTIDVQNVTWWMADCSSYNPIVASSSSTGSAAFQGKDGNFYKTGVYMYDAFESGDVDTSEVSGTQGVWVETAGRLFGALTVDGANSTAETTADGYPEDGMTLLNGAKQWASGNALGLLYQPAVAGNWAAPAPTTVGEALDRLAAANPGA